MSWFLVVLAGLFEVVWVLAMKLSQGFTRPGFSLLTLVALVASIGLLGFACRQLPLGVAYSLWVGIGVLGSLLASSYWLGESLNWLQWFWVALILLGVMGLKISTPG